VFACLFLDNRHRVIKYEELFFGTINGASVHPREIVKRALHHNAAALIAAHNHPSGVAEPSSADEQLTRRLKESLALIDVLARHGRLDEAIEQLDGLMQQAERKESWLLRKGDLLARSKRPEQARRSYRQALLAIEGLPAYLKEKPGTRELIEKLQSRLSGKQPSSSDTGAENENT